MKRDLANQQFGRLTALYDTGERKNSKVVWHCKCNCGVECDIVSTQLTSGKTQSCGCLQRERTSQARSIDLTGQKFGLLTALYSYRREGFSDKYWHCKCDCGNEWDVRTTDLRNGHTTSCGCLMQSKGEAKIEQILRLNQIPYQKEFSFEDLFLGENELRRRARFDFYTNGYCIEFDGIQHFRPGVGHYDSPEKFARTQKYDRIKNEYCLTHNIPLIRIPYTRLDELCLEDLLLETSQFIIKKQED